MITYKVGSKRGREWNIYARQYDRKRNIDLCNVKFIKTEEQRILIKVMKEKWRSYFPKLFNKNWSREHNAELSGLSQIKSIGIAKKLGTVRFKNYEV